MCPRNAFVAWRMLDRSPCSVLVNFDILFLRMSDRSHCAYACRLHNKGVTWNGDFVGLIAWCSFDIARAGARGARAVLRPKRRPVRSRCGAPLMESDRDPDGKILERILARSPQHILVQRSGSAGPCTEIP